MKPFTQSPLAKVAPKCPHCGCDLDGRIVASFTDGKLVAFSQTKLVGNNEYTWMHAADGCYVPSLTRLLPTK